MTFTQAGCSKPTVSQFYISGLLGPGRQAVATCWQSDIYYWLEIELQTYLMTHQIRQPQRTIKIN